MNYKVNEIGETDNKTFKKHGPRYIRILCYPGLGHHVVWEMVTNFSEAHATSIS
jgi:hypothetical protein